jgi:hypothetical protein
MLRRCRYGRTQTGPRAKRRGRYVPESDARSAKIFPAIVASWADLDGWSVVECGCVPFKRAPECPQEVA